MRTRNLTPSSTTKALKIRIKLEDGKMPMSHLPSTLVQFTMTNQRRTTREEDRLKKTMPKEASVVRSFMGETGLESSGTTARATQFKSPMTVCNVGGCKPACPTATEFQRSPNLISTEAVPTISSSIDFIHTLATRKLQKRTSLLIFLTVFLDSLAG